jgi:hypothetical protein
MNYYILWKNSNELKKYSPSIAYLLRIKRIEFANSIVILQGWVLANLQKKLIANANNKLCLRNTHKEITTKRTIYNMQIVLFGVYIIIL